MADIVKLSRLLDGVQRQVDLTTNSLVVNSVKVSDDGGSTSSELNKTILDKLLALQNGSDFSNATNSHTHDGRYYTESEIGATTGAALVGFDNSTSGMTATDVQDAIDEVEGRLDTAESSITTNAGSASDNAADIADLRTTQGTADGATNLGTFTGSTITDSNTVKGALQELETSLELKADDSDVIKKDGSVTFTAAQSMGGFKLTSLATPTAATDAVTKGYVDSVAEGLKPKEAVRAASTADGVLATAFEDGDTLDGVTLATGDRILLKNQTDASENGVYVVAASGAPTRSTDFDSLTPIDEINGAYVAVQEGTANSGKIFVQSGVVATIDTDDIDFVFFNSTTGIIAGDGIDKTGETLDIVVSDFAGSGLENDGSNNLRIASGAAGTGLTGGSGSALSIDFGTSGSLAVSATSLASNANGLGASLIGIEDSGADFTATTVEAALAELKADLAAQNEASEISFSNGASGLTATNVQAAIDEVEGRIDTLEASDSVPSGTDESLIAGEAMAATTMFAVRWAKPADAETAGRVFKADNDASLQDDFHVCGIAFPDVLKAAADSVAVTKSGPLTVTAHGLTVGEPIWLGAAGVVTQTAPSADDTAVVKLGMVRDANTIEVQIQIMGIA